MFTTDTLPPALSLTVSPKDKYCLVGYGLGYFFSCVNTSKHLFLFVCLCFGLVLGFFFVLIWVFENGLM